MDIDLIHMKKRLQEISNDLYRFRNHRLSLSTQEFYQIQSPIIINSIKTDKFDKFLEIKKKINSIGKFYPNFSSNG